jgi:histidinol-phosphate aminotransferase
MNEQRASESTTQPLAGDVNAWSRRQLLGLVGKGGAAASLLGAGAWGHWGELRLPELLGSELPMEELAERKAARLSGALLLDSNENPFGMCAAARERLVAAAEDANRYPGEYQAELRRCIADFHDVPTDHVATGSGSTDILRQAAGAWVRSDRALVQAQPTFEALGFYSRARGFEAVNVRLDSEGRHDLEAMRAEIGPETRLVYICNPGNPSGTLLPQEELDAFIEDMPSHVIVLVDEAYHHYVDDPDYASSLSHYQNGRNVLIARTFSKVYGMAGLRAGYAIGAGPIIEELRIQRLQNNINAIAGACAVASLEDTEYHQSQKRLNSEARKILTDALTDRGFDYWDSHTNFVMIMLGREVVPVIRAFRERGVYVGRPFPDVPENLRVSIGTPDQMRRFVKEFDEVLGVA